MLAPEARMPTAPRQEYPRPQLQRARWTSLNGTWRFAFDDHDRGRVERWFETPRLQEGNGTAFDRSITVPFCYQAELSGIAASERRDRHDIVWYGREFDDIRGDESERLILHFGAVDYRATVWVNGAQVAEHEGGHTPFSADINAAVVAQGNVVIVRAEDPMGDLTIPRGKQYWGKRSERIFYTPTTGIWQSVWLEPVAPTYVRSFRVTPDVDSACVDLHVNVAGPVEGATLRVSIGRDGADVVHDDIALTGPSVQRRFSLVPPVGHMGPDVADWQGVAVWTPENPALYDLHIEVHRANDDSLDPDAVTGYFGMRKVETRDGRVLLNGRPYYLRLVLDQGYFPGGILTAATDDDLRGDIEAAKALGFNGARKHQKVEDPRWLHWADKLGFLVWGELANAYQFSEEAVARTTTEWQAVIARDYNHPCIVAWVPMNESWGVPALGTDPRQRALLLSLYHLTHSLDSTRPVVSNDGWEQARTDLLTIHDYGTADSLRHRYADAAAIDRTLVDPPSGRPLYTSGHTRGDEPILITEFGGIAVSGDDAAWGYHTVRDGDELLERYEELIAAIAACDALAGFCYTQLTDVEQEANGLLTFDRKPKNDPAGFFEATRQGTG